jgi:hypothetical protein
VTADGERSRLEATTAACWRRVLTEGRARNARD